MQLKFPYPCHTFPIHKLAEFHEVIIHAVTIHEVPLLVEKVSRAFGTSCSVQSLGSQAKSSAIYTIFLIFCYFFAHFKKKLYLCSAISPRLGIMSFGWGGCRHNKASISALCLATWNFATFITISEFSNDWCPRDMYIYLQTHLRVCICACISAWASVLLVQSYRQCEGLK